MAFLSIFRLIPSADGRLASGITKVVPPIFRRCRAQPRNRRITWAALHAVPLLVLLSLPCWAAQVQPASASCPRFAPGATIENPPEFRSHDGKLELSLHLKYQQTLTGEGPPRYCYVTDDGLESPTLRVAPGEELIIHRHNDLPAWRDIRQPDVPIHPLSQDEDCAGGKMDSSFTNLHFHGMTIPPVCHQDEVIRTAIPPGGEFDYRVTIPPDLSRPPSMSDNEGVLV